jgi:hypothetical protein
MGETKAARRPLVAARVAQKAPAHAAGSSRSSQR